MHRISVEPSDWLLAIKASPRKAIGHWSCVMQLLEIERCFTPLLEVGEWRATPTTGFLEAFDIPVAVGGSGSAAAVVTVL